MTISAVLALGLIFTGIVLAIVGLVVVIVLFRALVPGAMGALTTSGAVDSATAASTSKAL